ncbi:MAG: dephospho-CoA kinase [Eubacterium sp.]|nr:dephospho-CoA kinase [Eubacterium sp.]
MTSKKPPLKKESTIPVLGITGGVGSGKSEVMNMLHDEFGGALILADLVGHDLMQPGEISYEQILARFGRQILDEKGNIDRKSLGAVVFADPEALKDLNQITHPNIHAEIVRRIEAFRQEGQVPFIALEAALLIEGGYEDILDQLWYVHVSEENRIKRLMEGRGYTREKSLSIMRQQLSEEEFFRHADVIIDNNGSLDETRESVKDALYDKGLYI